MKKIFGENDPIAKILDDPGTSIDHVLKVIKALDPNNEEYSREFLESLYQTFCDGKHSNKETVEKIIKENMLQYVEDLKQQYRSIAEACLAKVTLAYTLEGKPIQGPAFDACSDIGRDLAMAFFLLDGKAIPPEDNTIVNNKFKKARFYQANADPFMADSLSFQSQTMFTVGDNPWRDKRFRLLAKIVSGIEVSEDFSWTTAMKTLHKLMAVIRDRHIRTLSMKKNGELSGFALDKDYGDILEVTLASYFELMSTAMYNPCNNPVEWAVMMDALLPIIESTTKYAKPFTFYYKKEGGNLRITDKALRERAFVHDLFFLKGLTAEELIYTLFDVSNKVNLLNDFSEYLTKEDEKKDLYKKDSSYSELFFTHLQNYYERFDSETGALVGNDEIEFVLAYKDSGGKTKTIAWKPKYHMKKSLEAIKKLIDNIKEADT
ncbi:MAG: hypothetical protein ACFFDI_29975, partial [Promethearchaeota archaeon]